MDLIEIINSTIVDLLNEQESLYLGDTFDVQDSTAEETVGRRKDLWGRAGVWRERFENAGDILRELSARGYNPDPRYLEEKVNKIDNWLNKTSKIDKTHTQIPDEIKTLDDVEKSSIRWSAAVDGREYLEKFHSDILNKLISEYNNIPVYTEEQQIAKNLVLNLLNNNIPELKRNLNQIREIVNILETEGKLVQTRIR